MNWLETWTRKLNRSVEPVDDLAGAAESIALTLVSRLASWAASIPNAIMVSRSAVSVFEVDQWVAITIAVSLELIGQSLTAHWRKCKNWNASKRKTDVTANARLALVLMIVYFAIDLLLVFCLAFAKFSITDDPQIFLAMAYPIIGIVTAIITNERASLFRMAKARQIEKEDRKAQVQVARELREVAAKPERLNIRQVAMIETLRANAHANYTQLGQAHEVSRTTAKSDTETLIASGRLRRNGKGWEVK